MRGRSGVLDDRPLRHPAVDRPAGRRGGQHRASGSPTSPTRRSRPTSTPASHSPLPARSRSTGSAGRSSNGSRETTTMSSASRYRCSADSPQTRSVLAATCGRGSVVAVASSSSGGCRATGPIAPGTVGVALVLTRLCFWAMQDAIVDDGYINLGYVRMLREHFEWGMLPGMPSNTATSPANVDRDVARSHSSSAARWPRCGSSRSATAAALAFGLTCLRPAVGRRSLVRLDRTVVHPANPLLASSLGLETIAAVTRDGVAAGPGGGRRLARLRVARADSASWSGRIWSS